jgi:hypothetical protein
LRALVRLDWTNGKAATVSPVRTSARSSHAEALGFCHFCHWYPESENRKMRVDNLVMREHSCMVPTCPESREPARDASNEISTGLSRVSRPKNSQVGGLRAQFIDAKRIFPSHLVERCRQDRFLEPSEGLSRHSFPASRLPAGLPACDPTALPIRAGTITAENQHVLVTLEKSRSELRISRQGVVARIGGQVSIEVRIIVQQFVGESARSDRNVVAIIRTDVSPETFAPSRGSGRRHSHAPEPWHSKRRAPPGARCCLPRSTANGDGSRPPTLPTDSTAPAPQKSRTQHPPQSAKIVVDSWLATWFSSANPTYHVPTVRNSQAN